MVTLLLKGRRVEVALTNDDRMKNQRLGYISDAEIRHVKSFEDVLRKFMPAI